MSEDSVSVYERLMSFAASNGLPVRELDHAPEGRTDLASKIRGHSLASAVKAMVVMVKRGKSDRRYFLACVPGDRRVDFSAIKRLGAGDDVRFAPEDRAASMTGCVMGSVPPISFHPDLKVLVDPAVLDHPEVVFNAGRLDKSIFVEPKAWFAAAGVAVERISV